MKSTCISDILPIFFLFLNQLHKLFFKTHPPFCCTRLEKYNESIVPVGDVLMHIYTQQNNNNNK
jgi:hypothetical protein